LDFIFLGDYFVKRILFQLLLIEIVIHNAQCRFELFQAHRIIFLACFKEFEVLWRPVQVKQPRVFTI
jgi:hypothetical protein